MSEQRGLYDKYNIPSGSFLLKPERDSAARAALRTYAAVTDNEQLSADITEWVNRLDAAVGEETP